jgi:predicted transcriptional regulator
MTKTDRIRALLAEKKLTVSEIAQETGVLDAYVRVVKQRDSKDSWMARAKAKGDDSLARKAGRRAYERARKDGKSYTQAQGAYSTAYRAEMARTAVELAS